MARSMSGETLRQLLASTIPPLVLDIRREVNFQESPQQLVGAQRFQPEDVQTWAETLPRHAPVVAYCVHGRAVSQGVASALEGLGFDAYYLEGGIEGWKSAGGAVTAG